MTWYFRDIYCDIFPWYQHNLVTYPQFCSILSIFVKTIYCLIGNIYYELWIFGKIDVTLYISTLQEFWSLSTQRNVSRSYEKCGHNFYWLFFGVGTLRGWNPSSFSLPTLLTLCRQNCPRILKSWTKKTFSPTKEKMDRKIFSPTIIITSTKIDFLATFVSWT